SGDLRKAVTEGRRKEFDRFPEFRNPAMSKQIPDPQAKTTFEDAKLTWDELGEVAHREWLSLYKRLIEVRKTAIMPLIPKIRRAGALEAVGAGAVAITWEAD